jgi:dCTP deaminase
MLTGPEILRHVRAGTIVLDPFKEKNLGANSYDLELDPWIKVYKKSLPAHEYWNQFYLDHLGRLDVYGYPLTSRRPGYPEPPFTEPLDMRVDEETVDLTIPAGGLVLYPGVLYLAATVECAGSALYVPCVEGRSSIGRIAVFAHTSAGFGDLDFSGPTCPAQWTLEMVAVQPVRVYAGIRVCQIFFTTPHHGHDLGPLPRYTGKYTGQKGPKASNLWKDFVKGPDE